MIRTIVALACLVALAGCGTPRIPEGKETIAHHTVAMNFEGAPLDPGNGLTEFASNDEFESGYLQELLCAMEAHRVNPGGTRQERKDAIEECIEGKEEEGSAKQAKAVASDPGLHVVLLFHGALNSKSSGLKAALDHYQQILGDGLAGHPDPPGETVYPIFVNWEASIFSAYFDHLWRTRQGQRTVAIGPLTSPFVFALDLLKGIVAAPETWAYQLKHRWTAEFPNSSAYARNARSIHERTSRVANCRQPVAECEQRAVVSISPYSASDEPGYGWTSPLRFGVGVLGAPIQLALSPLVESGGTAAWTNYVRRTHGAVRNPREFDDRFAGIKEEGGLRAIVKESFDDLGRIFGRHREEPEENKRLDWKPTGTLGMLMDGIERDFGVDPSRIRFTLIGHSTGAIIVNRLIEAYPQFFYERIVYLASAATVDDFSAVVVPYMSDHSGVCDRPSEADACPRTRFFSASLDYYAEARENVKWWLPVIPTGSLLEWLDLYFTSPPSATSRAMGKWENVMATKHIIPEHLRGNVTLTKIEWDAAGMPRKHGQMNDLLDHWTFWRQESWERSAPP